MIAFGSVRDRFGKSASMAKLADVFQCHRTSSDSPEDKWMKWVKLIKQASATSLCGDARQTLTIAGLEKAKERSQEQRLRLHTPQTCVVICTSVGQYSRTTVDSITAQPTPMEIEAVVSTCA